MKRVLVIVLCWVAGMAAPAGADDSTRMDRVDAQNTNAVTDSPLRPPLRIRWQVNPAEPTWQAYVDDGRMFGVQQVPGGDTHVVARSLATGAELWRKTFPFGDGAQILTAVDAGRVFVVYSPYVREGRVAQVHALDAASGANAWTTSVPARQGLPRGRLIVDGGQLFFLAHENNVSLHALRQSDGARSWEVGDLFNSNGGPVVDADRVFLTFGDQTRAYRRTTGELLWQSAVGPVGGEATRQPTLFGGRLYSDGSLVLDPATGATVGNWPGGGELGFAGSIGVHTRYEGTRMFGPGFDTTLFETGGKGRNLIAGNHLYLPSGDGGRVLYSVGFDGKPDWCHTVSAPTSVASGYTDRDATLPVAAGDGTLIVTAGDAIIAFENGGTGSVGCQVNSQGVGPPPPPVDGSFPPATAGPSLAIQVGRRELFLGQRTNLTGRLSGVPLDGSTRVTIETDEFPYDDRWRTSGRGAVNPDGTFAFKYSPRRNARLRARAAGLLSEPVEILADFPSVTRVLGRRGPRPRVRWTIFAYRGAKFRQRRVHAYLLAGRPLAWRRVDSRRWEIKRSDRVIVDMRYPRGRLGRKDKWLVCYREPTSDGFGRVVRVDPYCGNRVIPRDIYP
jgi:hypothetical protein